MNAPAFQSGELTPHHNATLSGGDLLDLDFPAGQHAGTCAAGAPNVDLGYGCVDWFIYIGDSSERAASPLDAQNRA